MKKYLLVLGCAVMVFAVAGCSSKNQLKCTGEMDESGVKMKTEVIADFDKDDKLTDAVVTYDLGDKDTASQYCSFFKLMEDKDKGIIIDCSGSKITIKGYANVISDDEEEEEEESAIGKTKEEFKKLIEVEGVTCK